MADPILPTTAVIVGPAIDAIAQTQPQAVAFIASGGYWAAVPKIFEAQTDVALARVADEVKSARLRFAQGVALAELCASEFNLSIAATPQAAYATIFLGRGAGVSNDSTYGSAPAGVIKAGTIFTKQANPNAFPIPIAAASYQAVQTVYVPQNAQLAVVPCVATTLGSDANVPTFTNTASVVTTLTAGASAIDLTVFGIPPYNNIGAIVPADPTKLSQGDVFELQGFGYFWVVGINSDGITFYVQQVVTDPRRPALAINAQPGTPVPAGTPIVAGNAEIQAATPLFDPSFQVIDCDASGGSPGMSDTGIVTAARANAVGQYGPTDGALVAGVLTQQSVGYYAHFRASAFVPYAQLYVADSSWGSSGLGLGTGTSWTDAVAGQIRQNWQGFNLRVRWGQVVNRLTAVRANIYLKTIDALAYTQAIDANVRAAIRSYFDDRNDWYLFRLKGLAAAIGTSDPNIQKVTGVTVSDAVSGAVLSEPAAPGVRAWSPTLTHYYVGTADGDSTVTTSYLPPS